MIRVLIVEDSLTARSLLTGMLAGDPEFCVLEVTSNGMQAVEAVARLNPDVVSMDIFMPVMDGLEATRMIMHRTPVPIVIVSGHYHTSDLEMSFNILRAGALAIIPKPVGPMHPDYLHASRKYRDTLRMMSRIKFKPAVPSNAVALNVETKEWRPGLHTGSGINLPCEVVVIGASAGGPMALQAILSRLKPDFHLPVLIVQHIDGNFASGFAEWLNSYSNIPVSVATNNEKAVPGHAYLPPGDFHLGFISKGVLGLSKEPPEANLRPSVNHLFRSTAKFYGNRSAAVLLSGMGKDGASELKKLHEMGAMTIAQDQNSALVHGMPGEAIRLGAARLIASPDEIVNLLNKLS